MQIKWHQPLTHLTFTTVAPMVWVENQHELAPVGGSISLGCNTESYPPAIHFWTFANGTAIGSSTLETATTKKIRELALTPVALQAARSTTRARSPTSWRPG